jgi:hypothetical protein
MAPESARAVAFVDEAWPGRGMEAREVGLDLSMLGQRP